MIVPQEIADVVCLVALTLLAPGVCLVLLAKFAYPKVPPMRRGFTANHVARLGWVFVLLACVFLLYVQMSFGGSNGPGGLGSFGNPIGALAILAFAFVVGPLASIVFVVILAAFMLNRRRARNSGDM